MRVLRRGIGLGGHVSRSLGARAGGANQLRQTVLDPIDLRELSVKHNLVIGVGERYPCAGSGLGGLNTKECIQGVGDSLDLFNLKVLDGTEVEDGSVCRADL